jgi:hypothetical protein
VAPVTSKPVSARTRLLDARRSPAVCDTPVPPTSSAERWTTRTPAPGQEIPAAPAIVESARTTRDPARALPARPGAEPLAAPARASSERTVSPGPPSGSRLTALAPVVVSVTSLEERSPPIRMTAAGPAAVAATRSDWALEALPTRRAGATAVSTLVPPAPRPEPSRSMGELDRSTGTFTVSAPRTTIASRSGVESAAMTAPGRLHGAASVHAVPPPPEAA